MVSTNEEVIKMMTCRKTRFAMVLVATALVVHVQASTRYVDLNSATPAPPYTSPETAATNIQAAVDASSNGDIVLVSDGTYLVSSEITVANAVVVESMNGSAYTVIDGNWMTRCFNLGGSACTISGFTIQNGYTAGDGAGVYCSNGVPIIENCMLRDNEADNGGGMYNGTAKNCVIRNNMANLLGGGMHGGFATNCLILDNRTRGDGAGIYRGDAVNCTIANNTAVNQGGGMFEGEAKNSIVWYNTAGVSDPDIFSTICNYTSSPLLAPGMDGNISAEPLFVDWSNGDYRLQAASLCVDAGSTNYVSSLTDLDGLARVFDISVDMGAYEFGSSMPDADLDGIPDAWELQFFGSITGALASGNADMDSQTNGDEFIAGTDPTNAASFFQVATDAVNAGNPSQHVVINWKALNGRVYNVLWARSLEEDFQPLEIGIQYPQNNYTDTVHAAESTGFYRVVVMRSDYDMDGDGLPNDWESAYAVTDAYADSDDDGFNNLAEFISGTDPTNAASFFAVANSLVDVNGTNCFVLEWISVPERIYSIQWSANLSVEFQNLETHIAYPQNSYTDLTHRAESSGYYRVNVQVQ